MSNQSPKKKHNYNAGIYKSVEKMEINNHDKSLSDLNLTPCFKQKSPLKAERSKEELPAERESLHNYKLTSNFIRAGPRSISNNVTEFEV